MRMSLVHFLMLLLLNSVTSFSFVLELLMLLAIKSDEGVIKIYLHTMCNQFRFGLKFHVANLSQIANQFMNVLHQNLGQDSHYNTAITKELNKFTKVCFM